MGIRAEKQGRKKSGKNREIVTEGRWKLGGKEKKQTTRKGIERDKIKRGKNRKKEKQEIKIIKRKNRQEEMREEMRKRKRQI